MVLTLYGQGPGYWSGLRDRPNEANPQFNQLLQRHPLAFVAGGVAWVLAFSGLILFLPRRLSLWAWLALVMGHTWGMSTWIRTLWPEPSYWVCFGLWGVVSGAAAFTLDRHWHQMGRESGFPTVPE